MHTIFDFRQLIAPLDTASFISDYYEKKPLVIKRSDHSYYNDLLTAADIDTIIRSGVQHGNLRLTMSHAARKIQPEDYMNSWTTERVAMQTGINPSKLFDRFLEDKATMIIHNATNYNKALQDLVASTDQAFSCNAGVNLFITPNNAQCFQVHYDEHDLFIIQISGTKHWKVFQNAVYLPLEPQNRRAVDFSRLELLHDIHLEQGDLLYLPRGFVHEVNTTDQISCHITLGILNASWIKRFADYITQLAFEDPAFRKAYLSNANRSEEERRVILSQLKLKLLNKLTEKDVKAFLEKQPANTGRNVATPIPSLHQMTAAPEHMIS